MSTVKNFTHNIAFLSSLIVTVLYNLTFYKELSFIYAGASSAAPLFGLSCAFLLFISSYIFIHLLSWRYTTKPLLVLFFTISSFGMYFNIQFKLPISDVLIANSLLNNGEINLAIIFNLKAILFILFFAILPSYFVYRVKITYMSFYKEATSKLLSVVISSIVIYFLMISFGTLFSDLFTAESDVLKFTNPFGSLYSFFSYFF